MSTFTLDDKQKIINYPEPGWVERATWCAITLPRLIEEEKKRATPKRHYERSNATRRSIGSWQRAEPRWAREPLLL
jgi:hypothetical protein